MNRLPFSDDSHDEFPPQPAKLGPAVEVADRPLGLLEQTPFALPAPHRLFFPQHFEPRYRYPLVIWLHSDNSSEYELDDVVMAISPRNYIAVGLRGPQASRAGSRKFCFSLQMLDLMITEDTVLAAASLAASDLAVDQQRIFIGGFGVGGSVAQWVALRHADRFAGAISINGPVPDRGGLLANWHAARRLPLLFLYGDHSSNCPTDEVVAAVRMVHRSGLKYQFMQFATGDELDGAMTAATDDFIMRTIAS